MSTFNDHFSQQAAVYALARPTYPKALFDFIFSLCSNHELAWDCATGNGQTAIALAEKFTRVIATDASRDQLQHAFPHKNVEYQQALAENAPCIKSETLDLITVSTALHWFDQENFYTECNRVLKSQGVLAVWSYFGNTIEHPEIDKLLHEFAYETLIDYWPAGAKKNWVDQYKDVVLPFEQIDSPRFFIRKQLSLGQYTAYINSWSAVIAYLNKEGKSPLNLIEKQLFELWGNPQKEYLCTWNLVSMFSRKP